MIRFSLASRGAARLAIVGVVGCGAAACTAGPAGGTAASGSGAAAEGDSGAADAATGSDAAAPVDGAAQPSDGSAPGIDGLRASPDGDTPTPDGSTRTADGSGPGDVVLPPDVAADAGACVPTAPPTEVCDGLDNDCNGKADDSAVCDDGDACTTQTCDVVIKACSAPTATVCNDGNPCTDDACSKATGCTASPKGGPCDDGNACTNSSACTDSQCVGGDIKNCDDGNSCTVDTCAPKTGCASAICVGDGCGNGLCDDGNPCTTGDVCLKGTCKPGPAKCNDNNPCTTDSCDPASGNCATSVPMVGCKVCTVAADCNDGNDCTSDTCAASICAHKVTVGCIGPTDYAVTSFKPVASTWTLPGQLLFKLYAKNEGKPFSGAAAGNLKWEFWVSVDATLGADDVHLTTMPWNGAAPGVQGVVEKYNDVTFFIDDPNKVPKGAAYACVRLKDGGDVNQANNETCTAVKFVFPPIAQFQVVEWLASAGANGKNLSGSPTQFTVSVKNLTATSASTSADIYLSSDATWSAEDTKLTSTAISLGTYQAGQAKYTNLQATLPPIASGPKFACVVVNPTGYALEENPTDNSKCVKVDLWTPADLSLDLNQIRFRTKAGAIHDNPPYGLEYGCYFTQVPNAGPGPAVNVPAHCWLSPTKQAFSGAAGWSMAWKFAETIDAKAALKAVFSPEVAKVAPTKLGETYVCADLNYDNSVDELTNENYVCRKIAVVGPDLYVYKTYTVFGAANVVALKDLQNPPTTVTRGVAVYAQVLFCNMGNQTFPKAAMATLSSRMLLSTDDLPSADDHVIQSETSIPYPVDMGTQSTSTPEVNPNLGACHHTFDGATKFTLPLTLAAGNYKVLFEINHKGEVVEPSPNNLVIRSINVK